MSSYPFPERDDLIQAPERALLFVLDAALASTEQALRREHPTLDFAFEERNPPPTLGLASELVLQIQELRSVLRDYEDAVDDALRPEQPARDSGAFEIIF